MKLDRAAFVAHLKKIHCGGQVSEVVFTDAFQAAALTEDQQLFLSAPKLPKTEPLAEPIGVADLPLLIRSLGTLSGAGNEGEHVYVSVEDHRLVLNEQHRGSIRLMTASPTTIGTKVEPQTQDKLLEVVPDGKKVEGVPITRALIDGIEATFGLLKAEEIEVHVGPTGGAVVVGNENSHVSEFPVQELQAEEPYTLLFGRHLVDVLGEITDYTSSRLYLLGPDNMAVIQDGAGYTYILSPRARPVEG